MNTVYFWMRTFARGNVLQGRESGLAETISTAPAATKESDGITIFAGHTVRVKAQADTALFSIESVDTKRMPESLRLPRAQAFDFFAEDEFSSGLGFACASAAIKYAEGAGTGSPFDVWRASATSITLVSLLTA